MNERERIEKRLVALQTQANALAQRLQKMQVEIVKLTGVLEYFDSQKVTRLVPEQEQAGGGADTD